MTPAVHALIQRGNEHRDRGRWADAVVCYECALEKSRDLTHIWVQLGHTRKEAGDPLKASEAYLAAASLQPHDPALVGWIYSIAGRVPPARRRELIGEIYRLQGKALQRDDSYRDPPSVPSPDQVVFDVSDLVAYFSRARRPTGIQRVQIEIISAALELPSHSVRVCCSIEQSAHWVEIPRDLFRRVVELSVSPEDKSEVNWRNAIQDLNTEMVFGSPIEFGEGAKLINLGTSWWLQNYFLQVRNARYHNDIEYIPFIHDLIPVLAPQHCVSGLVEDFNSWILGVFDHASRFFANSEATKADLLRVAGMLGRTVADHDVTVVPLDGLTVPIEIAPPSKTLIDAGLDHRGFVLFVSTIESRKGHIVALRAWQRLLSMYRCDTPYLVCVGNNGWLNQQIYDLLDSDPVLGERVILLSALSDTDLRYLYHKCLLSIYPSTYEGWGLPITEALSAGKLVIAADNSSLPQAGGTFAVYTRTLDYEHLAEEVAHYAFDPDARAAKERVIREQYRPRSWEQIARQIIDCALSVTVADGKRTTGLLPVLKSDVLIDFRRETVLARAPDRDNGERLRFGTGWNSPSIEGCSVLTETAKLRFLAPFGRHQLVVEMTCRHDTNWGLVLDGRTLARGRAVAAACWQVICQIETDAHHAISLLLESGPASPSGQEHDVFLIVQSLMLVSGDSGSTLDINGGHALGAVLQLSEVAAGVKIRLSAPSQLDEISGEPK